MAALVVVLGGGALAALETDVVSSFGGGIWWALSLATTVGFVGGVPASEAGRAVAAVLMIFGFGLMTVTTAAIASLFVREDEAQSEERDIAFERAALEELRALHERLDALDERLARQERERALR